jgi:hypothetical protein
VEEAVRRNLMPGVDDQSHDFGTVTGYPPKHEEGTARTVTIEHRQKRLDTSRHSAWAGQPLVARDDRLECFDLEILFDIDSEKVGRRASCSLH